MSYDFLFADDLHIHRRNFAPLYRYVDTRNVPLTIHDTLEPLKRAAGDLHALRETIPALRRHRTRLAACAPETLFDLEHEGLRVRPLCTAETLCCSLATRSHWHDEPLRAGDDAGIFARLVERERDVLLDNMAAACVWIDEWRRVLGARQPAFTHAFVFSGSMTYGRVLLELCRFDRTRAFVLESTFTGKEFYVEERHTPIANRSQIRHATVRRSKRLPELPEQQVRDQAKAIQRLFAAENKNVTQPDGADLPRFPEPQRPTLLVVGQVVNDYSLIEQRRGVLSSIAFYEALIARVLRDTNCNVVFKGHPWEERKVHLRRPFTRERLQAFADTLSPERAARFAIRDHDNLVALGGASDRVALLSSQAGIELAFYEGLRPSTFGTPYYGGAGFTDAFDPHDLDPFIDACVRNPRAELDLAGYEALLDFLQRFLQHHVVTERTSGLGQIVRIVEASAEIGAPPPRGGPPKDQSLPARTRRKLRKLRRDPRAFFLDAKLVRALQGRG